MAVKKKTSLSFQIPRASYTENLAKQKPNLPGQLLSFTPSWYAEYIWCFYTCLEIDKAID